jgi:hypothetical protein
MAGWSRNGFRKHNAIDAVLKVKAIWIAVCFTAFKRSCCSFKVIKAWFDAMNEIYKKRRMT